MREVQRCHGVGCITPSDIDVFYATPPGLSHDDVKQQILKVLEAHSPGASMVAVRDKSYANSEWTDDEPVPSSVRERMRDLPAFMETSSNVFDALIDEANGRGIEDNDFGTPRGYEMAEVYYSTVKLVDGPLYSWANRPPRCGYFVGDTRCVHATDGVAYSLSVSARYFPGRINLIRITSPELDANTSLVGDAFGLHVVGSFDMLQCANFGYVEGDLSMTMNGLIGAQRAAVTHSIQLLPTAFPPTRRDTARQLLRISKYRAKVKLLEELQSQL